MSLTEVQVAARPTAGLAAAVLRTLAATGAVVAVSAIIVGFFDGFWWPPDEGAYAYVAQRILQGDVLHRDIQDIHAGYVNFANAAAMAAVGESLLSLRYPLAVMAWIQAVLMFWMLRHSGETAAAIGAIALTALSTVQFLDPTAHWYALFLAVLTIFVLAEVDSDRRGRVEFVGFLLMATFLFRQLSGVFLAMGAVTWLLMERSRTSEDRSPAGLFALVVLALGVVVYLAATRLPTNLVLFGTAPIALLVTLCGCLNVNRAQLFELGSRLLLGGLVAATPLVVYHLVNGSIAPWFDDAVLAAFSQTSLDFIHRPIHLWMLGLSAEMLTAPQEPAVAINALLWIALLLLPAINGLLIVRALRQTDGALHPLPVVAVFFAMVSVHHQIPIYLWFSSGLSAVAFLWLVTRRPVPHGLPGILAVAALSGAALYWHAGQPVSRGFAGTLQGQRSAEATVSTAPRIGLRLPLSEATAYEELTALIAREVTPEETILALPNNAELYFLADRKAATRFWNAAFGVRSPAQASTVLRDLEERPPRLVFHAAGDKYNTPMLEPILDAVRRRYELVGELGELTVYRLPR